MAWVLSENDTCENETKKRKRPGDKPRRNEFNKCPPAQRVSQQASSHAVSAARASLRASNGPSLGPPTGERSAFQRPVSSGSTCEARRIETLPREDSAIASP